MAEHSFLKRNWKVILSVATLVALAVLMFAIRHEIIDTFNNLRRVDFWLLFLLLPLTAIGYHAQTKLYQDMFGLLGNKLKYWPMMRIALELNFVNTVFPSGGVSGISYFGVRMRNLHSEEITATRASLVQIMKLLLTFISFELLLIVGLVLLSIGGNANDFVLLVAGSISTLMVVGTVLFVAIIGSERRIHATFSAITRGINKVLYWFRPGRHPETISVARAEGIVQDLHVNFKEIRTKWAQLRMPLFWALLINITAILSIYVVYISFGEWVNIGAIILAYSVANFAGLVSVLPGGIGVYEALMTGVLAAAGVSAALSLPVTVMFRVLSTLIQLPPGYYFYYKAVHGGGGEPPEQAKKRVRVRATV